MADATILSGDIGVTYFANNRQKRLEWIGGTETEYTMNEIYSAMQELLDEETTIDDGTCFSAETPTEYTIGKIDTGDAEPWYISYDCMEHVTDGALKTQGWTRVQDSNTGIVCVQIAEDDDIVAGDAGFDIVHSDGDTGTLLEFIDTGNGSYDICMIRPDSSAIGNSFDAASSDTLTCNGHVVNIIDSDGIATTGEQIWANLYSIGTIDSNVHLYLYQGAADDDASRNRVFSWNDGTQDWYSNGHIDTVVALHEMESSTWAIIDDGYITVFARKYGDLFASFEVACSATSGGRNPIPLQSAADLDNTTGIKNITYTTGAGVFVIGDIILGGSSGARGILTAVDAGNDLDYIPIDDPQVAFTATENISAGGTTGTNIGAPTDFGPAQSAWYTNNTPPTIAFTYDSADVDDDSTDEDYGITINCQSNPLTEVYEWAKWQCRNGETTNDLDGINGERYIGAEVYLEWSGAISGTIAEGDDISQAGSLATGVVIALDDTADVMLLRDTRGTFNTTGLVTGSQSGTFTPTTATTFAPKTASPLGTFAGGTFFGARGVLLEGYLGGDTNSFILTDMAGNSIEAPLAITLSMSNLEFDAETSDESDRIAMFRLDGAVTGPIKKDEYTCVGGEAIGDTTIVTGAITSDTVGKSTGGTLILVDDSDNGQEYAIRYASWDTATFTLANLDITNADGGSVSTVIESGVFGSTKRGDLVYNHDLDEVTYVKTVDSANQITVDPPFSVDPTNDHIELNCVPVVTTSSDNVYVPFMYGLATAETIEKAMTYSSTTYYRVKVRNTRDTDGKIKPFTAQGTISGSDVDVPTVRTEDTIIT